MSPPNDIGGLSWAQFRALPLDRRSSHLASFQRLGGIVDTSNMPPGTLVEINGVFHTKDPETSRGLTGEHIRGRHYGVRSRSSYEFDLDVGIPSIAAAAGQAFGSSIVEGVGSSVAETTGEAIGTSSASSTGTGTVTIIAGMGHYRRKRLKRLRRWRRIADGGIGSSIAETTGESLGTSSVTGIGHGTGEGTGSAAGTSVVIGISLTEGIGFGTALGTSTATGFSMTGIGDMIIEDTEPHTAFQVY